MEGADPRSWKDDIPEADRECVDELRRRLDAKLQEKALCIKEALNNAVYLARFARARQHDVDKAWEMLETNLKWRAENDIDAIDKWAETDVGKELITVWPNQDYGFANEGRPLIMEQMTLMDPEKVFDRFSPEDLMRLHYFIMERDLARTIEASEREGRAITDTVVVENVEGLGFHHVHQEAMDLLKACLACDEKNYPELAGALIVINAPMIFPMVFSLLKPFIDAATASKIQIYSGKKWKKSSDSLAPDMERFLPLAHIPAEWGGGQSEIQWARTGAPEESDNPAIEFTVAAKDQHAIDIEIEQDGSQIAFQFTTEANDISFGVELVGAKKKTRFPVEMQRVDSHTEAVSKVLFPVRKGTYRLIFDNTYSYMTAKQVTLIYNVRGPLSKAEKRKERRRKMQERKKAKEDARGEKKK